VRDLVGDEGHELRRARPRPDDGDAAIGELDRVVPGGRVERRAFEGLPAGDVRERRAVELAHGTHDSVELLFCLGPVAGLYLERPGVHLVVVARLGHLAAEADAGPEAELLDQTLEVGQQVGLGREARRPVVGLREREAVELVGHVDAAAGVDVLEPGAADLGVLLEHGHGDAGLAQAVCGGQPRRARADHGATERAADLVEMPAWGAGVGPVRRQLLDEEWLPLVDRVRPGQEGEDLSQLVSGQRVVRCARVLVRGQDLDGDPARGVLLFGPEAASRLQELRLVRGELVTQDR
jgi:hypothetical protein